MACQRAQQKGGRLCAAGIHGCCEDGHTHTPVRQSAICMRPGIALEHERYSCRAWLDLFQLVITSCILRGGRLCLQAWSECEDAGEMYMKAFVETALHDETDKERHPELFNPFTNLAVAEEQMLLRVGLCPQT